MKIKFLGQKEYQVEFYLIDAFEIYHFMPLYNFFMSKGISCCFVAENEKRNSSKNWFNYKQAIEILKLQKVNYKKIANYDAEFVFTTQDERLVSNYKNTKINLCYGYALGENLFLETAESIKGFDLMLVHGQIGADVISRIDSTMKTIKVGYPRYSQWGDGRKYLYSKEKKLEEIKRKNVENKPIMVYFPTWEDKSTIDNYAPLLEQYKDRFFIVTKAHHCTFRLWRERFRLEKLKNLSDVLLEGNFSFQEASLLGDIGIVDAMSGAATEVPYTNPNIKLILVYSPLPEYTNFKSIIDDFAVCVKSPDQLDEAINRVDSCDDKLESRKKLLKEIYYEDVDAGLEELYRYMTDRQGKSPNDNDV